MAQANPAEVTFVCRFASASPGRVPDDSYRDFCAFEFPGCSGCPKAFHPNASVATTEDPLNSKAWGGNQSRRSPLRPKKSGHLAGRSKSDAPAQDA